MELNNDHKKHILVTLEALIHSYYGVIVNLLVALSAIHKYYFQINLGIGKKGMVSALNKSSLFALFVMTCWQPMCLLLTFKIHELCVKATRCTHQCGSSRYCIGLC